MQHLHTRLWIAIAISTLTVGFSHAAIAKPQVKSPTPQINSKQRVVTKRLSQTNLAKVGVASATQPKMDRSSQRQASKVRGSQPDKNRIDRTDNGVSQFTDPNRNLPRAADVEAINNLIE
jgi:hypothetical protein